MIKLEPLAGHHERKAFDCGVAPLDTWLKQTALQHQTKGISRTFVAIPAGEQIVDVYRSLGYGDISSASILGFYALASAFVFIDNLPSEIAKRYPRQVPVTRLGRLAIRADMQGQGLGRLLLADAVNRAESAAQAVGSAGLFVDAKDETSSRFYQSFGFRVCDDQSLKLYLPMW
jgi:ribosomal protein S18 acetylase RimI-like enzyme